MPASINACLYERLPPFTQVVQRWHFGMLNDAERNAAYDKALRARVRAGDVVLDIGAGTGLLGERLRGALLRGRGRRQL